MAWTLKKLPAMQETQVPSLGWEDTIEKGMTTHPSIPPWRIPGTGEAGGLQLMGSQRVRHAEQTTLLLFTFLLLCIPSPFLL